MRVSTDSISRGFRQRTGAVMLGSNPVFSACLAAFLYGTSTFLAGRSAVRIGSRASLTLFQATGCVCALGVLLGLGGMATPAIDRADIMLAAISGMIFSLGWMFFSQGLAFGRTTVVAPVECMTSVSFVALLEGIFVGWSSATTLGGVALAAVAGMLVAADAGGGFGGRAWPSTLFGLTAGLLFGCSYIALGLVSAGGSILALVVMRFFAAVTSIVWLVTTREASPNRMPGREARVNGFVFAVAGGIADGLGTYAFIVATLNGLIGVSVAILSLYAAVTVALGVLFLGERPTRRQTVGFAAAIAAVVVLSR